MNDQVEMLLSSVELSFEISELTLSLDEIIKAVEKNYPGFHFNRTEPRYDSCIIAVFEKY